MKKQGFVFLLLLISGSLLVCDVRSDYTLRRFRFINQLMDWTSAQSYCRETFMDLATIQNLANITEVKQLAGTSKVWIGLFNGTWRWSQEEDQDISSSSWFTYWYSGQPGTGNCVVYRRDGTWFTKDCGLQYQFFCYDAVRNNHILVDQLKTWSEAQTYCRSQYTDLSSIQDVIVNGALYLKMILGPSDNAWIGLHRSYWVWSDGSNNSFRSWGYQDSTVRGDCVLMDSYYGTWSWKPCREDHPFLCYIDIRPSVDRSVRIRLSAGSADLDDPEVQESILQQLKQEVEAQAIPEEVRLRWQTKPDGKIFHREEATAPPAVCHECDTV